MHFEGRSKKAARRNQVRLNTVKTVGLLASEVLVQCLQCLSFLWPFLCWIAGRQRNFAEAAWSRFVTPALFKPHFHMNLAEDPKEAMADLTSFSIASLVWA